jgi:hydroxymethylbilane synthase
LHLDALVAEPDGTVVIRASGTAPVHNALQMGESVAWELMAKGAQPILARLVDGGNAAPQT